MKLKRYDINISGRARRRSPVKRLLTVLLTAFVAVVGYSMWKPVSDFLGGAIKPPPTSPPPSESVPAIAAEEPAPPAAVYERVLAVPGDMLGALSELTAALPATGVALEMKDDEGRLFFLTEHPVAQKAGAVQEGAVDAAWAANSLAAQGFTPIAKVSAFLDHLAPRTNADLAVRYKTGTGVRWLDDAADKGGRPWLNPYAQEARQYIIDLVCELVDAGFTAILLTDIAFPDVGGAQYAWYSDGPQTHTEILEAFVNEVKGAVGDGVTLMLEVSGKAALGLDDGRCYATGDPFSAFSPDLFVLDISPALLEQHLVKAGMPHHPSQDGLEAYTQSVWALFCARFDGTPPYLVLSGEADEVDRTAGTLASGGGGAVMWVTLPVPEEEGR